jgi:rhodanese-related sulfurtransferase
MIASITAQELQELIRHGQAIELIDVRTPAEFRSTHLQCARNVPLDQFNPGVLLAKSLDEPVYLICQKGGRGQRACEQLCAAGFTRVFNVEGGTTACVAAGLPVVRGQKSVSLERQVRIVAGSLVLAGALLGMLVDPYWTILPTVIGAGLLFSGITDTCGMALLLAKMPWNRVPCAPADADSSEFHADRAPIGSCCSKTTPAS